MTDGQGRTVDFTNTVIIMTSNLGAQLLRNQNKKLGFIAETKIQNDNSFESAKDKILQEVKRTFRPEFINRIDEIIVFRPLSEEHLRHIVKLMMNAVQKKMDNMNITIDISDKALE